jgi:hypothetical protein
MHSSPNRKTTDDPHDFVVVPSDHIQVAQVAPSDDEISDLLRTAARQHAEQQGGAEPGSPVPPLDTTFRATDVNNDLLQRRRSIGRRVMRALTAVVLAACIGAAAMAWQASGYAFKKLAWKWLPKAAITTSLPLEKMGLASPSSSPSAEPATSEDGQTAAAQQPQPAPASAEAQPAINSAQPADSPQSMARDLASVGQEIEALKASIAELKASQQQMARELAKANEQNARARLAAAPPHPAVAPRKPAPPPYTPSPTSAAAPAYRPAATPYPPTQAAASPPPQVAQPYPQRPVETLPPPPNDPGLVSAPRPPMPVQ